MTTPTTVQVQIQLRADIAANWTAENPTLLANEVGLETDTKKLKVGDGTTAWTSLAYFPSIVSGGTVLGNLEIGTTGTLTFEGSTANGFETTLAVTDPTADRTITLPDQSGTVVVTGNASIVDADIAANAEIAVSKLADGAARQLLQTDAAGTGVEWTDDIDVPGTLDVTGAATFDDDVTIQGDLTVNGTTTTIDTTTLVVEDKNIEIGKVATPTDVTADGGGITLKGSTDKTINWEDATDAWTLSEHVDIASAKEYRIAGTKVLDATSLGSAVVSSSLTSVGTITTGTWQGSAIDATYLDSMVVTTGDTGTVTSTMIVDGTIVNGDINASAAIAGTKISPDFGSQNVTTTGTATAAALIPSGSTVPSNGVYLPSANNVAISTNGAQALYINADGDILVADGNRMEIDEIRARDGAGLKLFDDAGAGIFIQDGGNVGLGSSTPGMKLTLNDTTTAQIQFGYNDSIYGRIGRDSAGNYEFSSYENGGSLKFGTTTSTGSTTERVRIDSSGQVGIGTTSPNGKLHVVTVDPGDTAASFGRSGSDRFDLITGAAGVTGSSLIIKDSASNNYLNLRSGKVGIGFAPDTASGTLEIRSAAGVAPFVAGGTSSEYARIDSSGRLLVGTSSSRSVGAQMNLQLEGTNQAGSSISLTRSSNDTAPPNLVFAKTRSASVGGNTIVSNNDNLGVISFYGADGVDTNTEGASIAAYVDGTPGANDMPGRLVFSTTADGASSPTERMRISSDGGIETSANGVDSYAFRIKNDGNNSNRYGLQIDCGADDASGVNYSLSFRDGDGTAQGFITFTSGTVTYGAFTAHHPCILPEADNDSGYPYGTLLEVVSIEYTQKNGADTERGIRYQVQKSQSANSRKLLGAYGGSMNGGPDNETNCHQALVLGDGHILCSNAGGDIKIGDGIASSAVAGIGQKATASPSMIIGIAQEDVSFANDTEQKLVVVQYGLRQFTPWSD